MQVWCKSSNHAAETRCSVCGQGFVLIWERHPKRERAQALAEITRTLRSHHRHQVGPEAHPERGFAVGETNATASSTTAYGHAPSWAL